MCGSTAHPLAGDSIEITLANQSHRFDKILSMMLDVKTTIETKIDALRIDMGLLSLGPTKEQAAKERAQAMAELEQKASMPSPSVSMARRLDDEAAYIAEALMDVVLGVAKRSPHKQQIKLSEVYGTRVTLRAELTTLETDLRELNRLLPNDRTLATTLANQRLAHKKTVEHLCRVDYRKFQAKKYEEEDKAGRLMAWLPRCLEHQLRSYATWQEISLIPKSP
ncbi:hypothetical protein NDU88_003776 [Pleurodeles waltl]|uniref:Uncharacterized protein n=1 Tax=Pleurodeles waltl TaxID=8319 RepID=A0AAV7M6C6_PLEWA|nr:hypothetical protein NDU88_003776 [Pleurodeles waltl]